MRLIGRGKLAPVAACLSAIMLACPADAQSPSDGSGLRADDLLAIQVYAVGGGLIPFRPNSTVTDVDMSGVGTGSVVNQSGGASSWTPLFGARVHVPMFWHMADEQHLGFSIFFETGIQAGLGAQSFMQTFQNGGTTAGEFGSNTVREYWQVPLLVGVTLPIADRSSGPAALFDLYAGVTIDSWGLVLQGAEANAPGQQGFYGQNRNLTADPTVGIGLRMPVGSLDAGLPVFIGLNAELQFRPGSSVQALSSTFPVTYYGTVDPYANLAVMARIGVAFGSR
jgi:hypothetical protein